MIQALYSYCQQGSHQVQQTLYTCVNQLASEDNQMDPSS